MKIKRTIREKREDKMNEDEYTKLFNPSRDEEYQVKNTKWYRCEKSKLQ